MAIVAADFATTDSATFACSSKRRKPVASCCRLSARSAAIVSVETVGVAATTIDVGGVVISWSDCWLEHWQIDGKSSWGEPADWLLD